VDRRRAWNETEAGSNELVYQLLLKTPNNNNTYRLPVIAICPNN
jgi:hypothetical protein